MSSRITTKCAASILFVLAAGTCAVFAAPYESWNEAEFLPGRLIVTFTRECVEGLAFTDDVPRTGIASLDELFARHEVFCARRLVPDAVLNRLRTPPDFYHTYIVRFAVERPVLDVLEDFARDPHVRSVEPDLLRTVSRVPNDVLWSSQWDKRLMGAPAVWDVSTGSRSIICAGIDTGVDWNHPDLVPNLWVNPGEDQDGDSVVLSISDFPGDLDDWNDIDDDANGYVDDFLGWDFVNSIGGCAAAEDCDGHGDNDMSGINGHGTHVGGIMCAAGNNSIGVAGMSWVGRLMALRAGFQGTDGTGYIAETAAIEAILYAAAHGARIINMSYGGPGYSQGSQDALNAAWNQGCLLFAASGNEGSTQVQYPAGYENVIAVNATDNADRLAHWSNRGTWTDLCAPGANPGIMSTIINGYEAWQGTSMASPNAAGAAALVWSVFPNLTNAELADLLLSTARDITAQNPSVTPSHLGHGRVDVAAAVAAGSAERSAGPVPAQVTLHANFPNPFNASTTIMYDLTAPAHVRLRVFDTLGRTVAVLADEWRSAGSYRQSFDASHLSSGVYVAELETASARLATKMLLVR